MESSGEELRLWSPKALGFTPVLPCDLGQSVFLQVPPKLYTALGRLLVKVSTLHSNSSIFASGILSFGSLTLNSR